jgi:hypothetical protein
MLYDKGSDRNPFDTPHLFAFVIDEIIRDVQGGTSWYILFTDDVILVNKSITMVDQKLKLCKQILYDVVLVDESMIRVDKKLKLLRPIVEVKSFSLSKS